MDLENLLKNKWYPKFLPKTNVNSFKVCAWKVIVINSGEVLGKPLLCKRYGDGKTQCFSFQELEASFLSEHLYIIYLWGQGYQVILKQDGILKFAPK